MKISSGAKISKSTLKRSVKAIKEQDVLRNFSKDSSVGGIYVSLSYAPGSGKNTISQSSFFHESQYPQIIYVTINNIPRYRGDLELFGVTQRGTWLPYFRMESGGKIYQSASNYLDGRAGISTARTFSMTGAAYHPVDFGILRPAIGVDKNSGLPGSNAWFSGNQQSFGTMWHPKMVSQDPSAVMLGESPYIHANGFADYMNTPGLADNANKAWQWIANEKYVNITFPIYIRQSLLPDNGKFGLTRIQFTLSYLKELLHENYSWYGTEQSADPNDPTSPRGRYDLNNLILLEGNDPGLVNEEIIYGDYAPKRDTGIEGVITLSSVNELPTYGVSNNTSTLLGVRPANFEYHPTTNLTNFAELPESSYNKPELILSEDGKYVKRVTLGKWFSIDKEYGKNIAFKCEWWRNYEDQGWGPHVTQNAEFTRSNIKLEDLSPAVDFTGVALDQNYLKYYFQAYNNGFEIQGETPDGAWNGIKAKITARLVQDGQIYESSMFTDPVYAPVPAQVASSALGYYYYGGEGFEGIGVSNL